jgi:hypothetical protein
LDSSGVPASIDPDVIFRDLTTAWAFALLGTRQVKYDAISHHLHTDKTIGHFLQCKGHNSSKIPTRAPLIAYQLRKYFIT